jgi:uncharacterized protein YlxW (UPF0749 family)
VLESGSEETREKSVEEREKSVELEKSVRELEKSVRELEMSVEAQSRWRRKVGEVAREVDSGCLD